MFAERFATYTASETSEAVASNTNQCVHFLPPCPVCSTFFLARGFVIALMSKFYTPPKFFTERNPKKWWVCRCFSFSKSLFSGSMLVFNFPGCKILLPKARPILVSIASKRSLRFVFWALPLAAHASLVLPSWVLRLGVCLEDLAEALEFFFRLNLKRLPETGIYVVGI